jgi:subtilisin family serine protease
LRGLRPAWSSAFAPEALRRLDPILPLDGVDREWAWGGSTGKGVKVAVVDSGVDADHPAVAGVSGYVAISEGPSGLVYDTEPHGDVFGHGNACAGIIRALAPECEIYSVRVLGPNLSGRGSVFAAGLRWAVENGMNVCNLSLSTSKRDFFGVLHELADRAYFGNVMLVASANNMPGASYPATYASVFSVASHEIADPYLFYYNPNPPVEFGAYGIDVRVAWSSGAWQTATGNSFATPHIAGIVAKILGKYPDLTIFQMKAILRALADNVVRDDSRETPRGEDGREEQIEPGEASLRYGADSGAAGEEI